MSDASDQSLGLCPIGMHFVLVDPGAKRCAKYHHKLDPPPMLYLDRAEAAHRQGDDRGWTSNLIERVVYEPMVGAFLLGGWDAAMLLWFGEKGLLNAPFLLGLCPTVQEARMDYLLLTGRIPHKVRLTDGSADGWIRRAGGRWDRVFFPPLCWDRVDLDGMLHSITINPV